MTEYYTTWGSVRGGCGHAHRSLAAAERCLAADERACSRLPGRCYSDRSVRVIQRATDARDYMATIGPGEPLPWDLEIEVEAAALPWREETRR